MQAPLDWPDATVASGDAVEMVRRLKDESDLSIRSHGGDFDLELLQTRSFDGRIQELVYRPTLRTWPTG